MSFSRTAAVLVALSLLVVAARSGHAKAKPKYVRGDVVNVDADTKTLSVKEYRSKKTFECPFAEKAVIVIRAQGGLEDYPADKTVVVWPEKIDMDAKTMTVRTLVLTLAAQRGSKREDVKKRRIIGWLVKENDQTYVKAKGQKFELTFTPKTVYYVDSKGEFEDFKVGDEVSVKLEEQDGERMATHAYIFPPKEQ